MTPARPRGKLKAEGQPNARIYPQPGDTMDAVTLILILLTTFNVTLLVMKVWGDKFPQPHARSLHANWLQGWRNTQKPVRRFWIQVIVMFVIMMLFNAGDQMFAGFLVFVRMIVYCIGYKRAKQLAAQATTPLS